MLNNVTPGSHRDIQNYYDHRKAKGNRERRETKQEYKAQRYLNEKIKKMSSNPGANSSNRDRKMFYGALVGLVDKVVNVEQGMLQSNALLKASADPVVGNIPDLGLKVPTGISSSCSALNNTTASASVLSKMLTVTSLLAIIKMSDDDNRTSEPDDIKEIYSPHRSRKASYSGKVRPFQSDASASSKNQVSLAGSPESDQEKSDNTLLPAQANPDIERRPLASTRGGASSATDPLSPLLPLYTASASVALMRNDPCSFSSATKAIAGLATLGLVGSGVAGWLYSNKLYNLGQDENKDESHQPSASGSYLVESTEQATTVAAELTLNRKDLHVNDVFPAEVSGIQQQIDRQQSGHVEKPSFPTAFVPEFAITRQQASQLVARESEGLSIEAKKNVGETASPLILPVTSADDVMSGDQPAAEPSTSGDGSLSIENLAEELTRLGQHYDHPAIMVETLAYAKDIAVSSPEVRYAPDQDKAKIYLYKVLQIVSYLSHDMHQNENQSHVLVNKLTEMVNNIIPEDDEKEKQRLMQQLSRKTKSKYVQKENYITNNINVGEVKINIDLLDLSSEKKDKMCILEQTDAIHQLLKEQNIVRSPVSGKQYINELVGFLNHPERGDYIYTYDQVEDIVFDKLYPIYYAYGERDLIKNPQDRAFKVRRDR